MENNAYSINTFLSFIVDKEYFAVNVERVLEVLQMQKINRIPNVTSDILGVTNFRGEIIPVYDTRALFSLPVRGEKVKYVIVVLEINTGNNKSVIGAMVDKVKDVFAINKNELLPVPKMNTQREEYISSIYKLKNEFVMLIDVDKMFKDHQHLDPAITSEGAVESV